MQNHEWKLNFEKIIEQLYGSQRDRQDRVLEQVLSHDVKLEQPLFSVQGRQSVKHIFHLYRAINQGDARLKSFQLNIEEKKEAIVTFDQEFKLRLLPIVEMKFPAMSILSFAETENGHYVINKIRDIVDPFDIVASLPFVGYIFQDVARPLAGAALVAVGSLADSEQVKEATERANKLAHNSTEFLKDQRDSLYAVTNQYKEVLSDTTTYTAKVLNGVKEHIVEGIDQVVHPNNGTANGH